jgi:hypothetical protein
MEKLKWAAWAVPGVILAAAVSAVALPAGIFRDGPA